MLEAQHSRGRNADAGTAARPATAGTPGLGQAGAERKPVCTRTLPRTAESAKDARRLVSWAVRDWGLDELQDAAKLTVTELIANSVVHADRGWVRVSIRRLDRRLISVAVVDMSHDLPQSRPVGEDEESGRGLVIVDALSGGRWGVDPLPWGKRVWAELEAPGA